MTRRSAVWAAGGVLALLLAALADVLQGSGGIPTQTVLDALFSPSGHPDETLVYDLRLPRVAAGVVAGGALAAAAVLLQRITANPLAESSTLGLTAGGSLAVTVAAAYFATEPGVTTLGAAFAGVLLGVLLIAALAATSGGGSVRLILAGLAVNLALAAVTATVLLVREAETSGLFLWGAGSLLQQGWSDVRVAAPVAAVAVVAALLLGRALDVAALGTSTARALGQRTGVVLGVAGFVAALLTAAAVAVAGPLAFVGILAVQLARVARPRSTAEQLVVAVPWGGAVVLLADVLARLLLGTDAEWPAGVMCALLGAPVVVLLARGLREDPGGARSVDRASASARWRPHAVLAAAAGVPLVVLATLCFGELRVGPGPMVGAIFGAGDPLAEIAWELRGPRLCVALLAGGCLAAAGTVLQGAVRNPLAGPELVGVTGGASLGALLVLIVLPAAPSGLLPFAAFAGGVGALLLVLALAGAQRASPPRLALVGMAVTAACAALTALALLRSAPEFAAAVTWLAGSTYASNWSDLVLLAVPAAVLLPLAFAAIPSLDVLALGDDAAAGLGLPVGARRTLLLVLGAALAASAVAVCGAIAFVGLLAPHAARLIAGGRHARVLPVAVALGAVLLVIADAVGRTIVAPTEIPSGLVVSMIGTPYLVWLLWRSRAMA
ncbi:MAG: iron ABC transporter permease [Solirubrobacteraceae bacterium]|nr:iron ABC transporter permease [Solirubrobacteraceae bacterium]